MYIYFILVGVALLIAVSVIFLTVFVVKNAVHKVEYREELLPADSNAQWGGIRDFSDINSDKEGKVYSFKRDEFDTEVSTVGADISDFVNESIDENQDIEKPNEKAQVSEKVEPNKKAQSNEKVEPNKKAQPNEKVEQNKKAQPNEKAQSDDSISIKDTSTVKNTIDNQNNNDFQVVEELDYDATRSLDDIDYDATRSLDDIKLNIKEMEEDNKIKVTLKYKDANGIKIQKMDTSQITVGRGIGNDLLFRSDSFTSRNHAIFSIRDNELYLKDLNSKNGTFIDKTTKIEGEVKIEESCEVTFGDVIVEVIIEK